MLKIILIIIAYILIGIINYKLNLKYHKNKEFKRLIVQYGGKNIVMINEKIDSIIALIAWPIHTIVGIIYFPFKAAYKVGLNHPDIMKDKNKK